MLRFFEICFWTGVIFTTATFLLGQITHFMDFGAHGDFNAGADGVNISPLKPAVLTAFTTVFGGVGMMLFKRGIGGFLTVIISLFSAFMIGFIIFRFIIVPLYKAENTSAVSQETLIGHTAKVKLGIKSEGFGEITYQVNGNIYAAPARAIDDMEINKGEEVTIVKIDKNIFYVAKL